MNPDVALIADITRDWAAVGLSGAVYGRHLTTGQEVSSDGETIWPLASVVKLPVALVVYDAFQTGELDPAMPFATDPASATSGPTGLALFRHPSTIAAEDLVQLSLARSDNAATDLLLDHLGLDRVQARLGELGFPRLRVRHPMRSLYGTHGALAAVGIGLASGGRTDGGGHVIAELDPHRANAGSARDLVELLHRVWDGTASHPRACAALRAALGRQVTRHRFAVELLSDAVTVSSKTGTFIDLRHEAGVVDVGDHQIALVMLTRSAVPASVQMEADLAIGHAARLVVDHLRH